MSSFQLHFGKGDSAVLALDESHPLARHWRPQDCLNDVQQAVVEALSTPLRYPPISDACVPGDTVVLAIDAGVPRVRDVVAGVLAAFAAKTENSAQSLQMKALCAARSTAELLKTEFGDQLTVLWHDPENADELTYLAASKEGQPIYFNRLLLEADVVVPIGAIGSSDSWAFAGVNGSLFPAFSDAASQAAFQLRSTLLAQHQGDQGDEEDEFEPDFAPFEDGVEQANETSSDCFLPSRSERAAEAAWLLGSQFTLQVVAAHEGGVNAVLAGDCQSVEAEAIKMADALWTLPAANPASLVIAALDGDASEISWSHFASALYAARQACDERIEDGCDIVLCTRLSQPPGAALQELGADWVDEELERELRRRQSGDAATAELLFETLQFARVHLVSELEDDVVHALGMSPVQIEDVERMVGEQPQCVVIPHAQQAAVKQRVALPEST